MRRDSYLGKNYGRRHHLKNRSFYLRICIHEPAHYLQSVSSGVLCIFHLYETCMHIVHKDEQSCLFLVDSGHQMADVPTDAGTTCSRRKRMPLLWYSSAWRDLQSIYCSGVKTCMPQLL